MQRTQSPQAGRRPAVPPLPRTSSPCRDTRLPPPRPRSAQRRQTPPPPPEERTSAWLARMAPAVQLKKGDRRNVSGWPHRSMPWDMSKETFRLSPHLERFCYPYVMPRIARITLANMPYHVTQRGNAGQFLLAADSEKNVYLALLQKYLRLYSVALAGYCLMSNHVHLILVPGEPDALAVALKQIHGRFASFWNATHCSSGHVWQGRFYSCPLDDAHLWIALKYVRSKG